MTPQAFAKAGTYHSHRLARYDHLVVHCTATPGSRRDVDAKWVDREHRIRGWRGCGYHAVVTRDGDWQDSDGGFLTRPIGEQGAHVGDCGYGWNSRSFGVSLAGGVAEDGSTPENNFTDAQFGALQAGLTRFLDLHPHSDRVTILGHRDLIELAKARPKVCPCFDVRAWFSVNTVQSPDEDAVQIPSNMSRPIYHVIREGDTLESVAGLYGVSVTALREFNVGLGRPVGDMSDNMPLSDMSTLFASLALPEGQRRP